MDYRYLLKNILIKTNLYYSIDRVTIFYLGQTFFSIFFATLDTIDHYNRQIIK